MKKYLLLSFFVPVVVSAQEKIEGVYKSTQDYYTNSFRYAVDCNSKNKIRLNDFFIRPYVTVKNDGEKTRLNKKGIFGFRTCGGRVYRFLNKKELQLLNPGDSILVYRHNTSKPLTGKTNATNYYFSRGAQAAPQPLTFLNLRKAFPDNIAFVEELRTFCKYNTELAMYDVRTKKYELNNVFDEISRR